MAPPVVVTYLEINDVADLVPPAQESRNEFQLEWVDDPEVSRWFYERVGADYAWADHLDWTDERWASWAADVETWEMTSNGERAGYFELRQTGETIHIEHFGLVPRFHGLGLGGELLTAAIRRAFELGSRVTVETASTDAPNALDNYLARGMRMVRRRIRDESRRAARP